MCYTESAVWYRPVFGKSESHNGQLLNANILQGSVATCLRCDGIFKWSLCSWICRWNDFENDQYWWSCKVMKFCGWLFVPPHVLMLGWLLIRCGSIGVRCIVSVWFEICCINLISSCSYEFDALLLVHFCHYLLKLVAVVFGINNSWQALRWIRAVD